jgi:hypothetical protein
MKVNHNQIFKYYQKGIYPQVEKLYAIGDIHGDFDAFISCLKNTKLIDDNYHWCGGTAHVVQIGDILDRKIRDTEYTDEDSEFKIISLILRLQLESFSTGGGFHPVIGNHELMNILGIFDYVSPMGIKHFGNLQNRAEYFKIGGDFSKYLACAWNPVIKIGDYLFCHGGISKNISQKYTINDINEIMRDTLYGNTSHYHQPYFYELFLDPNSILWNRTYSGPGMKSRFDNSSIINDANIVLNKYGSKYLVVGHTPQDNGIEFRHNKKVICIDTGMSEAFGKKNDKSERIHYLEIINQNGTNKMNVY